MTKSEITMENHQTTEQKSSQSSDSELAESKERWKSAIPLKLILHNPWLIWIAVGAFLFTVISISLFSITNISYVKDETTPAGNANPTASPTSSAIALLLPGAVVLGCAVGAIAIAKRRQISSQFQFTSTAIARHRARKPKAEEIAEIVAAPVQHGQLTVRSSTAHPCPPLPENQPQESPVNLIAEKTLRTAHGAPSHGAPVSSPIEENQQLKGQPLPAQAATLTKLNLGEHSAFEKVGVGANQISHSLVEEIPLEEAQTLTLAQELEPEDSAIAVGTESLVEMLDIRKKLPLSAILGNYQQREP